MAENWLNWHRLERLVRQHHALIEADVQADGRNLYSYESFDTAGLRGFGRERRGLPLDGVWQGR